MVRLASRDAELGETAECGFCEGKLEEQLC